LKNKQRT